MYIINNSDDFNVYKNSEIEKAKSNISKDVNKLESMGCKVKIVCKEINNSILSIDRTSLSYNSLIIALIDGFLKKLFNKKTIQLEIINKILVIELKIVSNKFSQKSKKTKTIRYFVFQYKIKKNNYVIKKCNNFVYKLYMKKLIKKIEKNKKSALVKNFDDVILKMLFPLRTEEKEPHFFVCIVAIIGIFLLSMLFELFFG
ncbi:hypothetical protein J6Q66_01280 [bacterium]|nr:hypothetical protein [bacterium]